MSSSSSQFLRAEGSAITLPRRARCSTCSSHSNPDKTPRNLVVCIDGTANRFGKKNTNVVRLFQAVDCDTKDPLPEQYTYYSSGIGTHQRVMNTFDRVQSAIFDQFDMAIAWNMEEIVKDAYAWLAARYQEGDQIYLFGFSRGAYQVRILAGMIYEVGLIKNPTEKQIGTAYDYFESILSHRPNAHDMAREFRIAFSWKDARVHFIGVWDTVSSVGLGRRDVCLSASSAASHACHIRHALALDESRVKFIPEYFLEMNSPDLHKFARGGQSKSNEGEAGSEDKSGKANGPDATIDNPDIIVNGEPMNSCSDDVLEDTDTTTTDKAQCGAADVISCTQRNTGQCVDQKTADIKEVWFAGCHSDVGGTRRAGESFHAGKVSLTWMRREAYTCGLLLKPWDVLWTDEDLDFGTIDSMTLLWKLVEFLPVQHQISFNGAGKNARRLHLFEPRRIIPGQKIHASVQFANTYVPKATFGNGFGNPLETVGPVLSRENDVWEKDTIDHTTYAALFHNLTMRQATVPFYLHRLLFMLRFTEGRLLIKEVSDQQEILADLISTQSGLARLVAIAVYYEVLDSPELKKTLPEEIFIEARESFVRFIAPNQPDWPRTVPLLRPLAKHKDLRESILTSTTIDSFLQLLDHIISIRGEHFAHVMDALFSLTELYPDSIIDKLFQISNEVTHKDRLSSMLDINDPSQLTAVMRVVVVLTEQAPLHCRKLESRLHELATKRKGPVSLLAVQALVEISRAELKLSATEPASMPARYLHAHAANVTPARNWVRIGDSLLHQLFIAGAPGENRRKFIKRLLNATDGRYTRVRTAATFTLLKLCEVNNDIRAYLLDQRILDIFIKQLQFRDSALLAAYALTKCLTHQIFSAPIIDDPRLAGYIVNMIRLDYFDEAIGVTEGRMILKDLLQCDELRSKVLEYDIARLLEHKLGAGNPGEMRMSLIYLNNFRIHGEHALPRNLVERGLLHLETNRWRTQKAGVAILCSLAQTWFGVEALKPVVSQVANMLLPNHDPDDHMSSTPSPQSQLPSALLGPAFVLRIMAENEILREEIRQTPQYGRLKHLYLFGDLLGMKETPIWQVNTPARDDVLEVISQMFRSVDSVEGSTNAGFILPNIHRWGRVARLLRNGMVEVIVLPSAVAVVAALVVVGAITLAPVVVSLKVAEWVARPWQLYRQNAIIRSLRLPNSEALTRSASSALQDVGTG